MKQALKFALRGFFLLLALPSGLVSGFGRFRAGFSYCAQACSLVPGIPGDYLRTAFYRLTLRSCSPETRISFGTFFAHPDAEVEEGVYIGSYCVLGRTRIGAHTQIASHVQILSGARQHDRDDQGNIQGAEVHAFTEVAIGADCWIGAGAIVMADVGARTTVGAGAIVTKSLPANAVAVGNPAKVIRVNEQTPA